MYVRGHRAPPRAGVLFMENGMTTSKETRHALQASLQRMQSGKIGYILLWLLGVPIPILLIIYLLRGCT